MMSMQIIGKMLRERPYNRFLHPTIKFQFTKIDINGANCETERENKI